MLTKNDKAKFVKDSSKELAKYSSIAVIPLNGLPDRLLQLSRNRLKGDAKFILGRKTLLTRILNSSEKTKALVQYLDATSAIVLTNQDPFELYSRLKENTLKAKAKPNQAAPVEITIPSGETTLQPGQAVTELKQAGIDVQIQKGKVVIAKDKVIKTGEIITNNLAKALHSLNITPFSYSIEPSVVYAADMLYTRNVLSFTKERMLDSISIAFNSALQVSLELNLVNSYTINVMIARAYSNAVYLGVQYKLYDSGIIERLIERAVLEGKTIKVDENDAK